MGYKWVTARKLRPWLALGSLLVIGFSYFRIRHVQALQVESTKNFVPIYEIPTGWRSEPHGPDTLFKCEEPSSSLILRGAVNQIVSDFNPTPDLDTAGIAQFYVDRTKESMPEWTASVLRTYTNDKGSTFEVVRRATKDRVVVTAYSVRGNTTLLITLFGQKRSKELVDSEMGKLYGFLDTISLKEKDLSNL